MVCCLVLESGFFMYRVKLEIRLCKGVFFVIVVMYLGKNES